MDGVAGGSTHSVIAGRFDPDVSSLSPTVSPLSTTSAAAVTLTAPAASVAASLERVHLLLAPGPAAASATAAASRHNDAAVHGNIGRRRQ